MNHIAPEPVHLGAVAALRHAPVRRQRRDFPLMLDFDARRAPLTALLGAGVIQGGGGTEASDQLAAIAGSSGIQDVVACRIDVTPRLAAADLDPDDKLPGRPATSADQFLVETVEWVGLTKNTLPVRGRHETPKPGAGWGPWLVGDVAAARSQGIAMMQRHGVGSAPPHFGSMEQHARVNGPDPEVYRPVYAAVGVPAGRARRPNTRSTEEYRGTEVGA